MSDFKMEIMKDFDYILEENANSSLNLRKISWGDREPKLDLRKWIYKEDGSEKCMKGVTLSDNAANELSNILVELNYGDTRKLLKSIIKREDFDEVMEHLEEDIDIDDGDDSDEDYYDPSSLIE